jgi:predicted RNase H-like HicB family nuclease
VPESITVTVRGRPYTLDLSGSDAEGWCVQCRELPAAIEQGRTRDEAVANGRDAVAGAEAALGCAERFDNHRGKDGLTQDVPPKPQNAGLAGQRLGAPLPPVALTEENNSKLVPESGCGDQNAGRVVSGPLTGPRGRRLCHRPLPSHDVTRVASTASAFDDFAAYVIRPGSSPCGCRPVQESVSAPRFNTTNSGWVAGPQGAPPASG